MLINVVYYENVNYIKRKVKLRFYEEDYHHSHIYTYLIGFSILDKDSSSMNIYIKNIYPDLNKHIMLILYLINKVTTKNKTIKPICTINLSALFNKLNNFSVSYIVFH